MPQWAFVREVRQRWEWHSLVPTCTLNATVGSQSLVPQDLEPLDSFLKMVCVLKKLTF